MLLLPAGVQLPEAVAVAVAAAVAVAVAVVVRAETVGLTAVDTVVVITSREKRREREDARDKRMESRMEMRESNSEDIAAGSMVLSSITATFAAAGCRRFLGSGKDAIVDGTKKCCCYAMQTVAERV